MYLRRKAAQFREPAREGADTRSDAPATYRIYFLDRERKIVGRDDLNAPFNKRRPRTPLSAMSSRNRRSTTSLSLI
jgi:hypothetical protein